MVNDTQRMLSIRVRNQRHRGSARTATGYPKGVGTVQNGADSCGSGRVCGPGQDPRGPRRWNPDVMGYIPEVLQSVRAERLSADDVGNRRHFCSTGVFYIFKDEEAKQQFVANKYHRRLTVPQRRTSEVLFEQNKDVLEPFMAALTQYGRIPGPEELPVAAAIEERFGSLVKAFRLVQKVTDEAPWKEIAQRRTEDLLVYSRTGKVPPTPPNRKTTAHDSARHQGIPWHLCSRMRKGRRAAVSGGKCKSH